MTKQSFQFLNELAALLDKYEAVLEPSSSSGGHNSYVNGQEVVVGNDFFIIECSCGELSPHALEKFLEKHEK